MQSHGICFCCTVLRGYVDNGLITVNPDTGTCVLKVINVPTPEDENDQDPVMTKIPVTYCPNCGAAVITYDESIPVPMYTRATILGGSCNDNTCRFNKRETSICCFQYINEIGCYATSDAAKQSISDLLANVQTGYIEMTNQ